MEIINIDKDLIPYQFEMEIDGKTYQFEVNYNVEGDFFTLHLFLDGEPLVYGEKIVFGNILFDRYRHLDVPKAMFVYTQAQLEEARITYENFNEEIFIYNLGDVDVD